MSLGIRRALGRLDELIAMLALLVTVAAVGWGVVTRYVTAQPAVWSSEVAAIAFAWLTFFGASACFRYNAHPSIDMLVQRLPRGPQRWVRFGVDLLVAGFLAYFCWLGIDFSLAAWENPTAVLRLPMTVVYAPVTLATAMMLARHLSNMRRPLALPERAMA
ncbi:TRAP transporter small permease [Roseicella sp. DB1501]|uniref:TRAP transporter small permease n=1 Tax=Roseicella sp. DB1501 TaxID=2730925 RepID=UPI0014921911|nr:TRAP transporter small permease [Roseicella sp. DB1501]NOG69297.1 TRAP transporter small permease [Roseicella sp. DB1501]